MNIGRFLFSPFVQAICLHGGAQGVRVKRGNGKTEKRKRKCGKKGKRRKSGKKGKRRKSGKKGKRRKRGKKSKRREKGQKAEKRKKG